jgi:hypothetical protein
MISIIAYDIVLRAKLSVIGFITIITRYRVLL